MNLGGGDLGMHRPKSRGGHTFFAGTLIPSVWCICNINYEVVATGVESPSVAVAVHSPLNHSDRAEPECGEPLVLPPIARRLSKVSTSTHGHAPRGRPGARQPTRLGDRRSDVQLRTGGPRSEVARSER